MAYIAQYNLTHTKHTQTAIQNWLNDQIFSHFMSIRLPIPAYTDNLERAMPLFHKIVRNFERCLVGRHWNRNPVHFIGIFELGLNRVWHLHLLLWAQKYTMAEIQKAVDTVSQRLHLTDRTIDVVEIDRTPDHLNSYVVKEICSDTSGHFDGDRLTSSEIMFNLPYRL